MRAANASGSPRAVSLIVSPMTSSTLGLSALLLYGVNGRTRQVAERGLAGFG
jgi:hypothetical protein